MAKQNSGRQNEKSLVYFDVACQCYYIGKRLGDSEVECTGKSKYQNKQKKCTSVDVKEKNWNTVLIFDADAIVMATGSKRSVIITGHIRAILATERRSGY